MLIEIKSWINGEILHTSEAANIKLAVETLVKQGANLGDANLWGVNLEGVNLGGANLWGANLEGANLEGVYLVY